MDHEPDHKVNNSAGLEELTNDRTQPEDGESQEAAGGALQEARHDDGDRRGKQEDRGHRNYGSDIDHASRNTNEGSSVDKDNDNKEPRPAKQQKQDLVHLTLAY
jgi:hypothetical protein